MLAALHREVREETGLEIADARLLGMFSDPTRIVAYPDGTVCRFLSIAFRVAPHGDGEPRRVRSRPAWGSSPATSSRQLPFWPAHRPVRDALLRDPSEPVVE